EHCRKRGEPGIMEPEVGHHGDEGSGQHHALHRNVDHATALRDNAAQGRQEQQRAVLQHELPEVAVFHLEQDIIQYLHRRLSSQLVFPVSSGATTASSVNTVGDSGGSSLGPAGRWPREGSRNFIVRRKFAAMQSSMKPWSTATT